MLLLPRMVLSVFWKILPEPRPFAVCVVQLSAPAMVLRARMGMQSETGWQLLHRNRNQGTKEEEEEEAGEEGTLAGQTISRLPS